jgi:hypothetical protein
MLDGDSAFEVGVAVLDSSSELEGEKIFDSVLVLDDSPIV